MHPNEIAINDYLMVGDELLQVESMPTHPDDDIRLKGFRGGRTTLLDTSPRNHSVADAVYKVEIHPPGTRLERRRTSKVSARKIAAVWMHRVVRHPESFYSGALSRIHVLSDVDLNKKNSTF